MSNSSNKITAEEKRRREILVQKQKKEFCKEEAKKRQNKKEKSKKLHNNMKRIIQVQCKLRHELKKQIPNKQNKIKNKFKCRSLIDISKGKYTSYIRIKQHRKCD